MCAIQMMITHSDELNIGHFGVDFSVHGAQNTASNDRYSDFIAHTGLYNSLWYNVHHEGLSKANFPCGTSLEGSVYGVRLYAANIDL